MASMSFVALQSLRKAKRFACIASLAAIGLCALVLLGWFLEVTTLKALAPALPPTKANTAVCLALLATGIAIASRRDPPPSWTAALPLLAAAIAGLTVAEALFSTNFGIDLLLFADPLSPAAVSPGRMAPLTALCIVSLAVATLRHGRYALRLELRQAALLPPFAFGMLALIGHAYGVHYMPKATFPFATMAVPTALCLVLLALATLALDPDAGILRILLANRAGGRFARRMLPVAILFPVVVGWLRLYGERIGYYDAKFGVLIMVLSALTVFSAIAIFSARRLNSYEDQLLEAQHLLERRVQERTTELEASVLKLRAEMVLREAAEGAHAESQALFQNALESAPIGMSVVGLDGSWLRFNRAICKIVGYDERELSRLTFQDITHPDDLNADLDLVRQLLDGKINSYQMEKRYLRKDGAVVWVMLSASLVRDGNGRPLYFVAQIEDISGRRKVMQELEASRKLLTEVVAALPVPFALKGEDGRWMIANEALSHLNGRPVADLVGRTDLELFGPELAAIYRNEDSKALAASGPIVIEGDHVTASGEKRWVLKYKRGIILPDGRRLVAVAFSDISQRREIEERLRKSEERFRSLTDLSADWYWEQDENYRFTMQSGGTLAAIGLAPEDYIGRTRWELSYGNMTAQDWAAHRAKLDAREPYRDLMLARKVDDGTMRYIVVSGQPMFDAQGRFTGYQGVGKDITERKRAEVAVERSRTFLEAFIEAIPQPVFMKDAEHRWILFNTAFSDMLGKSREELLGRSDPDLYPPEVVRRAWAEDDEVLSGSGSVVRENSMPSKDGGVRWQLTTKRRVDLPDGSVGIVGVAADVTSLKQTQEALRTSETLHRLLSENSIDMITLLTPEGIIEYASPASSMLLGYSPQEIGGVSFMEFLHPDDIAPMQAIFTAVEPNQASVLTSRLRRASGGWMWIETTFRTAHRDGSSGLQIVAVSRDVDDRVRTGEALNRFKYVLDHTLDMIFIYDADTLHFNYVNDGAVKTLGYPKEKLLGMAPWELRGDISVSDYYKSIEPFLRGDIQSRQVETVHRRADGTLIPVDVTMQIVRRPDEPGTFISVARDATERKKVDQLKNEFVSTVSHELRTPLTSIRGSLGLLAGGVVGELPAQARELVDVANANAERLIRLINDILDIEKIESGKMRFVMQPLALAQLMKTVLAENRGYGEQFGVRFVLRDPVPDVRIRADSDRILQVMANLLSNAAKFSPRNAEVEIGILVTSGSVRISVRDHGGGIPEEFRERIFAKFSQADASDNRKLGGTGLGLSIAKAIIEKHSGNIGFTSGTDGTVFHFDLPLAFSGLPAENDSLSGVSDTA
ncbi:MAG TPA: PAS domain S-box protein [Burkholderiales bacterium]|nr:PAS domain S-box protein [Burkholderiales bacterium]